MNDSLADRIYSYLTMGHLKNGINWHDSVNRAQDTLNRMSNVEFLELISGTLIDMLDWKEDVK